VDRDGTRYWKTRMTSERRHGIMSTHMGCGLLTFYPTGFDDHKSTT
jgi:hypothetical protein